MKIPVSSARRFWDYPFYPWLFATYIILYLYSQNLSLVIDIEVLYILVITWLVLGGALGIVSVVVRNLYKAAAIVGIMALVFLTYGHIFNLNPDGTSHKVLYVVVSVPALLLTLAIGRAKVSGVVTERLAKPANIILIIMLIMPLYEIAQYYQIRASRSIPTLQNSPAPKIKNSADRPDIYYIILDGYSSNTHLMRDYNYDNSDFTDALESRGFFVAYNSTSNYATTLASLPSSLNMRYFNEEDRQSTPLLDMDHVRDLLSNNLVATELRSLGYTYINFVSGFTDPSPIADVNIDFYPTGPESFQLGNNDNMTACVVECYKQSFVSFFLPTTMLRPILPTDLKFQETHTQPYAWGNPYRHLATWQAVPQAADREEATFAFIHIVKPHLPIVFQEDGTIITNEPRDAESFFAQLRFVNQKTLEMVDQIIERSSVPPIIIIQGDHGTHLGQVTATDGYTYFEIMNAFYWPGAPEGILPDDITPVNTFRLLFNTYFGDDYPILDNRHFNIPQGYNNIFNMIEVDVDKVIAERSKPDANNIAETDNTEAP